MRKQAFIKNIALGALTLALVVGGLAVGERRAKAAGDIQGDSNIQSGDTKTYTAAIDIPAGGTVVRYEWRTVGNLTLGATTTTDTTNTVTAGDLGGAAADVRCWLVYTENSSATPTTEHNTSTFSKPITIDPIPRTITVTNLPTGNTMHTGESHTLTHSITGGDTTGAISWAGTPSTGSNITFSDGTINATAAGAHGTVDGITVSVGASGNYAAATSNPAVSITVNLKERTSVTITPTATSMAPNGTIGIPAVANPAEATGDTFTWETDPAALPAGVHLTPGTARADITADPGTAATFRVRAVAKHANYDDKASDWQTITIAPVAPVLTMTDNVSMNLYDAAGSKSITATSTNTDAANKPAYHVTAATAGIIDINAATGAITPKAAGVATVYATQAASGQFGAIDEAAATAAGYTRTVTVAAPTLSFNKTSVAMKKGETASVTLTTAGIPTGGAIAITSGNTAVVTVSPASATGSGATTVTITAVNDGTATIKAAYTQGATEYKGEVNVTTSLPATYFAMYSWYDYLNKSYPKTEVTAIQVNPGNTMGLQADTYWYVENPSILKLVWSTSACYNENGVYKSRCEVKGLRNGTTRVVVRTGDTRVGYTYGYYTITVTGNPYIPQTGPDDTPIYIVEVLLALTLFASAGVALYMKRREPQGRP